MRITKQIMTAVGLSAAVLLLATGPVAAAIPPLYYYSGPYATLADCQAEQQADPDAVGACVYRTGTNAGYYYKALIN